MSEQTIRIQVFSASQFYRECVTRSTRPTGMRTATVMIPCNGIHVISESSIDWIDGFFAENTALEACISAVIRREQPDPIISYTPHKLSWNCSYTPPELLAHSKGNVLSVFHIARQVAESALASHTATCLTCGTRVQRISSALSLADAILQGHGNQQISISSTADREQLETWASRSGFSIMHSPELEAPYIKIESGICTPESLTRISSVLQSLWNLKNPLCMCKGQGTVTYYSRQGWCPCCKTFVIETDIGRLAQLLCCPVQGDNSTSPSSANEYSLMLDSKHSVGDLLLQPVSRLDSIQEPPISTVIRLLVACELKHLSFSTPLTTLSSREVALLSIAASLFKASNDVHLMIIDIPPSIFEEDMAHVLSRCTTYIKKPCAIICLGGSPGVTQLQEKALSHKLVLHPTKTLQLTAADIEQIPAPDVGTSLILSSPRCTTSQIIQRLASIISKQSSYSSCGVDSLLRARSSIHHIPLFPARTSGNRTLADELGLIPSLAQLYAASVDARSVGLSEKDFLLTSGRNHRYLCRACKGLGVLLIRNELLPRARAKPCLVCHGSRFQDPVSSTLFRDVPYSTILNRPIAESRSTLSALRRCREALEFAELLELDGLTLGMPVALLSSSELRRLLIIQAALSARASNPHTLVIEEPLVGLSEAHVRGLRALQQTQVLSSRCRWVEID